jgi:uncharacterized membrane protein YcaP (DUF421 family)
MFEMGTPLWQVVVRTVVAYGGVLVALRVAGKRELGQKTVFDLVLILIANAVQDAMTGPDTSIQGGLVAAASSSFATSASRCSVCAAACGDG